MPERQSKGQLAKQTAASGWLYLTREESPQNEGQHSRAHLFMVLRHGPFNDLAAVMAGAPAKGEDHGINCVEGMPAVVDPTNLYSEASAGHLSQAVGEALQRVYVPEVRSNAVDVIDPTTFKVVDQFRSGSSPNM